MTSHFVFVYGSLKRGQCNHRLLATAEFVAQARTAAREFRLVDLGPYPAMIRSEEEPQSIVGELFRVDDDTLAAVDRLESNGSLYLREELSIAELNAPDRLHTAWGYLYLRPIGHKKLWPTGEWARS